MEGDSEKNVLFSVSLFEVVLGGVGSYLEQIVIFSTSKTSQLKGTAKGNKQTDVSLTMVERMGWSDE